MQEFRISAAAVAAVLFESGYLVFRGTDSIICRSLRWLAIILDRTVHCANRPKYLVGQMGLGLGPGNALLSLSLSLSLSLQTNMQQI